jgi:hypothetical protein
VSTPKLHYARSETHAPEPRREAHPLLIVSLTLLACLLFFATLYFLGTLISV